MKILIGSSGPADGGQGISSYSKDLVLALKNLGVEIFYICPYSRSKQFFIQNNIKYLELGQPDDPQIAVGKILEFVSVNKIDAVINNDHPYVQSSAPFLSIPFISVVHMWRTAIFSLACHNYDYVDYIVTISNDMRQKVLGKYPIAAQKVPVIYNGVVVDNIDDENFDTLLSSTPRVIFAGGENKKKGFDKLVASITTYPEEWRLVEVYWFGSVSNKLKNTLSGFSNITFKGKVPRDELLGCYRPGDIFLLPSREEGCPMALLEAMARGLIGIASDSRGSMDVIINSGVDGYIVPFCNFSDECIDLIRLIVDQAPLRGKISKKAYNKVKSQYTSRINAESYLDLIDGVSGIEKRALNCFKILKWHRPVASNTGKATLMNRLLIRCGILKVAGKFTV